MIFPLPVWIKTMPEGREKLRAVDQFYLQLACRYASRKGTAHFLATQIGINPRTFNSQINDQRLVGVPLATWQKISVLLGPDFVPLAK